MNAKADERSWSEWIAECRVVREEARVKLAPLVVKPPTKAQLAAMKRRARS